MNGHVCRTCVVHAPISIDDLTAIGVPKDIVAALRAVSGTASQPDAPRGREKARSQEVRDAH